ncbi:uncharacterized protein A1O5_07650 [Cladophialophora psammophila CBS 110553]|uniref:Uncharacterized protein n=1 Tax=Cladophialophora psammophila CBS 110553 TaxID=1182543 RepID=W9XGX5_9EURO|nr:uncharacterized protein A1O5_07650 [Cladophialophora psammophila CBS 110553]EXJ69614.1 hypothetical protein A1O5_07650 [Cladophialophora psammophila CBS 110553]
MGTGTYAQVKGDFRENIHRSSDVEGRLSQLEQKIESYMARCLLPCSGPDKTEQYSDPRIKKRYLSICTSCFVMRDV